MKNDIKMLMDDETKKHFLGMAGRSTVSRNAFYTEVMSYTYQDVTFDEDTQTAYVNSSKIDAELPCYDFQKAFNDAIVGNVDFKQVMMTFEFEIHKSCYKW